MDGWVSLLEQKWVNLPERYVQGEPRNTGAWNFVAQHLTQLLPPGCTLRYIGRPACGSPATGSHRMHVVEQEQLVREAFERA